MPLTVSPLRLCPPPAPSTAAPSLIIRLPSFPAHSKPCLFLRDRSRWSSGSNHEFLAKSGSGQGVGGRGEGIDSAGFEDEAERAARGESTMPERFRYLTKEAPDPPLRWPFFVCMSFLPCFSIIAAVGTLFTSLALAFLVYAWRTVLFELANWKKAVWAIVGFVGYLLKLGLALVFYFIGDPITAVIRCIETTFYSVRAFYSSIISAAPVSELIVVFIFALAVLAIGESVVPDCVNSQPYVLTIAGLAGYAIIRGYISVPFFLMVLVGMYGFSHFIKKRDNVTSALPVAAVLAGVGTPWLRLLAIGSYLALAVYYSSKNHSRVIEAEEAMTKRWLPLPLLSLALAVGIHAAAKWAGYRHLTWMIV